SDGQTQALSQVEVSGKIYGQLIYLSGTVGVAHKLNGDGTVGNDGSVTVANCQNNLAFCFDAVTLATSYAAALGADSDATANVTLNQLVSVYLHASANLEGDSIELHARQEHVNLETHAHATCDCGGADTDANAGVFADSTVDAKVTAEQLSTLKTAGLLVDTYQDITSTRDHDKDGGFLDTGGSPANGTTTPNRPSLWAAAGYLLRAPHPL